MEWHLILMAILYIAAGVNHFIKPKMYVRIMPPYFPNPKFWVLLSGVAEIVLGAALFIEQIRDFALYGIILMLILFFTVHIHMLRDERAASGLPKWLLVLRIPLQFGLIYWPYSYL